jgi:hypothetical protein
MADALPWFPRFVFTIFEPISLVAGFVGVVLDTAWFVTEQIPGSPSKDAMPLPLSDHSLIVARQLGNLYLLMAFIGLGVLNTTSEVKVVKAYLIALALGDIGHVVFSFHGLGFDLSTDVSQWNAMAFGNIAVTAFLFVTRLAYLAGLFGAGNVGTSSDMKELKGKKQR